MTHARAGAIVSSPLSPTSAATCARSAATMMPATPAFGTCWLASMPINLYALAYEAARMTVERDRQAWHRRLLASPN
jgi:hypothetical protein